MYDIEAYLSRQIEWSERTFGPGQRLKGLIKHITKELAEVKESGGDIKEWVDVIILAFDGAWRSGASPETICNELIHKQLINENREWPDWRSVGEHEAIEHKRDL